MTAGVFGEMPTMSVRCVQHVLLVEADVDDVASADVVRGLTDQHPAAATYDKDLVDVRAKPFSPSSAGFHPKAAQQVSS